MRLRLCAVLCVFSMTACEQKFTGDRGVIEFSSTLSRQSRGWTPADGVALGSSFSMSYSNCLFCGALRIDGADWTGNQQVLAGTGPSGMRAIAEGTQPVRLFGLDGDGFTVVVEAPSSLHLHDPTVLARRDWGHLRTVDGGAWPVLPDVGDELVMGADAGVLLDIFASSPNRVFLGSSAIFAARSDNGEVSAAPMLGDGRMLELISGPAGASQVSVMLRDGGLERTWPVRVAGVDEVTKLELAVVPVGGYLVLRAVATRADGGVFLEPPLEWEQSRELRPLKYWGDMGWPARERRDVKVFSDSILDGGVVTVSVRAGTVAASADLVLREEAEPPPPVVAPPRPMGCGCGSTEVGPLLLMGLVALLRGRFRMTVA